MTHPPRRPPEAIPVPSAAVKAAVAVAHMDRPTVRGVAGVLGMGLRETHEALKIARAAELVGWVDGQKGTLRALVVPVEVKL